ncbi:MAG: TonB-dependent receptor family protein [Staphylococcus sp.]|nr:TonB-dependent receptor family protein [Staphylococcus sp.]
MVRIIMLIWTMATIVMCHAESYAFRFNATPLPEAIRKIVEKHPDLNVNFIYNELENYKTSARVNAEDPYDALRQAIGLNPVTVVKAKDTYYVEALQQGKYVYTGHAIGTDLEPVVAATVMLLAPKDSSVITYGITDESGRFRIPCDRQKVIAKLSCLGYKTSYTECSTFNLGTIVMHEQAVKLGEVKVEAENSHLYSDRSVYIPTSRQKNAAQTAIDLLLQMAIPQLSINLVNHTVTTLTGQNVALYINFLPASSEEIEGIQTADVRRIEYLYFPSDPRFNGNEHVINFILPKYEYGGYTKLSVNENFLAGFSNRESLYSKFAYKRMAYDLYIGASNHRLRHVGTSYIGTYNLKKNDVEEQLTRKEIFNNAHFKYNQIPVTFRAVYDSDKAQISNTAGFVFDQSPIAETEGTISFTPNGPGGTTYKRAEPYTSRHVTWSGSYYFVFPHNLHLNINPSASYSHTNYIYSYKSSIENNIINRSRENAYQFRGSATLYKMITSTQNVFIRGYGGTNHNNVSYYGTSPYDNSFSDSYAGATVGYNFYNNRWNFNLDVALQWEQNRINADEINELYPLINISAAYSPSRNHSLRAYFHFGANYPGASDKTPNILQQNELMYITGNPDLGLSRQLTFNFQYNWIPRNNFSTSLFIQHFGERKLFVPIFIPYKNDEALLKSYEADANYNRTKIGLSFNYKMLGNKLQFAAQPSVTIYRMTGLYNLKLNPFYINASATYYLKNFYFQTAYQTSNKTIQGNRAALYRDRDYYQILAGWSHSGWNVRVSAINLLRNDWLAAMQTFSSPLYSETKLIGGNNFHRRFNVSITYTFNYGKKVKHSNEVGEQSGVSSAILK